ncbi:MAG: hypothetical protein ABSC94_31970 [Polyangiaceae bacterium]
MRVNEVARLLGGSIAIYVVVAACSAASGPQGSTSNDGGGGGSSGGHGGDGSVGILDALTDPTPEANADPSQSGTRLKLQYYAGSDGSKQTAGMFDSQLNVQCYFGKASDGTIRCLPAPSPNTVTASTQNYFADASCTQALGLTGLCSTPTVIAMSVTNNCTTTTTNYQAGSQFTGQLYQSSSTGCTAVSAALQMDLTASLAFYTLGAQIQPPNPSQYVEATLQTEP